MAKINRTYHFDSNEGRSVTCEPTAPNAEYSIQFRMDNDTAKGIVYCYGTELPSQQKRQVGR